MYMRIRKAREELGYTREKFAEKLDVSVSYLQSWNAAEPVFL